MRTFTRAPAHASDSPRTADEPVPGRDPDRAARRTALLELLPLDLEEVRRFAEPPVGLGRTLWNGGYPRIHERRLEAGEGLAAYTATYLERDVRTLLNVGDLEAFQTFLRMCAGRVGQLLNLSSLASDCGITPTTARRWLSVLEASFVVFRLQPFYGNLGKRLVKAPKLYFDDSGLAASLIGIERPDQLETHPLRGQIFEGRVVSEVLKQYRHRARRPHLFFYRERGRTEIDLVIEEGADLTLAEIKAGRTPSRSRGEARCFGYSMAEGWRFESDPRSSCNCRITDP